MWEDPIVEEVHRIREQIAAQFNYDAKAYFADVRRRQEELGDRLVRLPKTVTPSAENGGATQNSQMAERDAVAPAP